MTSQGNTDPVTYEAHGPAAWITLDRAEKRNALSPAMIEALGERIDTALADDSARVVVLTGSGSAFCAGADLELAGELAGSGEGGGDNPFAQLLQKISHATKPVIAAVNGAAFGGGVGLVAAADVAIASSAATFAFSEVRVGLVPAMISVVVVPAIGARQARRLFLTGSQFSADDALEYGLVHEVVSPMTLYASVDEVAAAVAKGGPVAVAEAKRLVREISGLPERDAFDAASRLFAERVASEEGQEGMAAFAEKRRPSWRQDPTDRDDAARVERS